MSAEPAVTNETIAAALVEVGQLLHEQGANSFRVQAYMGAASTLRHLGRPVSEIASREGLDGLMELPGIGPSLARTIHQLADTGRLPLLDRLRGEVDPVQLLTSVPGVGPILARRLHDELAIDTLEELEAAAHDGRLAVLPGLGEKRITGIRDSLEARLGRARPRTAAGAAEPPVSELLDVDREYRERVARGGLRRVAPRRFNPAGEAWLPVFHTHRGERHYTALFSNTARAHELGKTHDWVVLYYDDGHGERQCTVVTAASGPLRGKRVVRGREPECAVEYAATADDPCGGACQPLAAS